MLVLESMQLQMFFPRLPMLCCLVHFVFTVQAGSPLCGPPIPLELFAGPFFPKSHTHRGNTSATNFHIPIAYLVVNVCTLMLSLLKGLQSCKLIAVVLQLI